MARYISTHGKAPLEVRGLVWDGTAERHQEISKMLGPLYSVALTEDEGVETLVVSHNFDQQPDQFARVGEYVFVSELGAFTRTPTVFETAFKRK